MELMRTVQDSFLYIEEMGMRRQENGPRAVYS